MKFEFEYEISIKPIFLKEDWEYILAKMQQERFLKYDLKGIKNRLENDFEIYSLSFREIDRLSTLFENGQNPMLFKKCAEMCNAINEQHLRLKNLSI